MVTTEEGVPARDGPTNRLSLGIYRNGLAAWWTSLWSADCGSAFLRAVLCPLQRSLL